MPPRSMTCGQVSLDVFTLDCTTREHINAAVDMLTDEVFGPANRLRDPWGEYTARGQFRATLVLASEGRCEPSHHVKYMERSAGRGCDLYELRWQEIRVKERDAMGVVRPHDFQVRLFYFDLADRRAIVCLVAHVKDSRLTEREIKDLQDAAIDAAISVFHARYEDRWGVPELHS